MLKSLLSTSRHAPLSAPVKCRALRRRAAAQPRTLCVLNPVSGNFFDSTIVQQELLRLESEGRVTQPALDLFPLMNVQGKRITLDQLEGLSECCEVFYTRLRLSEDPQARAYLSWMRATMMEQDANLDAFFQTKRQFFAVLRDMLDLEEQFQLAGDEEAVALVRDAQVAWVEGRYEDWEQARLRGNAAPPSDGDDTQALPAWDSDWVI